MTYDTLTGSARPPKTAEIVANRIRKAIITGQLSEGERLPHEAQLTEDFGVSRPTIRETIRILESEGLIYVVRGAKGGARIRAPGPEHIARSMGIALQAKGVTIGDLFAARSMIEPPAAREAARIGSQETIDILSAQIAKQRSLAGNSEALAPAIAEFHLLLLECSENLTMSIVGRALYDVSALHIQTYYKKHEETPIDGRAYLVEIGFKSQEKLVGLIRDKKPEEAAEHWKKHMRASGKIYLTGTSEMSLIDIL